MPGCGVVVDEREKEGGAAQEDRLVVRKGAPDSHDQSDQKPSSAGQRDRWYERKTGRGSDYFPDGLFSHAVGVGVSENDL